MDSIQQYQQIRLEYEGDAETCSFQSDVTDEQLALYETKSKNCQNTINRKEIKVAVVGETSCGKSTLINAMVGMEVLPSGLGTTTGSIIEVVGCDDGQTCLFTDDGQQHDIKDITKVISNKSNSWMKLQLPKNPFSVLNRGIIVADMPGCDSKNDLKKLAVEYCLSCDIVVLVLNPERGFQQPVKDFFTLFFAQTSVHTVWVVVNQWDKVAAAAKRMGNPNLPEKTREKCLQDIVEFFNGFERRPSNMANAENVVDSVFFFSSSKALYCKTRGWCPCKQFTSFVSKLWKFDRRQIKSYHSNNLSRNYADFQADVISKDIDKLRSLVSKYQTTFSDRHCIFRRIRATIAETREIAASNIRREVAEIRSKIMQSISEYMVKSSAKATKELYDHMASHVCYVFEQTLQKLNEDCDKDLNDLFRNVLMMINCAQESWWIKEDLEKLDDGNLQLVSQEESCKEDPQKLSDKSFLSHEKSCNLCRTGGKVCTLFSEKWHGFEVSSLEFVPYKEFSERFDDSVSFLDCVWTSEFWMTFGMTSAAIALPFGMAIGAGMAAVNTAKAVASAGKSVAPAIGLAAANASTGLMSIASSAKTTWWEASGKQKALNQKYAIFAETKLNEVVGTDGEAKESKLCEKLLEKIDTFCENIEKHAKTCLDIEYIVQSREKLDSLRCRLERIYPTVATSGMQSSPPSRRGPGTIEEHSCRNQHAQ